MHQSHPARLAQQPQRHRHPPVDVRALVTLAEETDLMILADDIYDRFVFDGYQHLSPASLPGAKARTLTLNARCYYSPY